MKDNIIKKLIDKVSGLYKNKGTVASRQSPEEGSSSNSEILRRRLGFSLVGVMAAAGIMGGLALFLADMTRKQHAAQKKAETGVEITALSNRIVNTLYEAEACGETLVTSPVPVISPGQSLTVNILKNGGGRDVLESGRTYGNRLVKIGSMKLLVDSDPITGNKAEADFEVVFERVNRAYTGDKTLTKKFPLTLELDGSRNLKGCRSGFDSVAINLMEELCLELGGDWDSSANECGNIVQKACTGLGGTFSSGNCNDAVTPLDNKIDNHNDIANIASVHGGRIQDNTDALGTKSDVGHTHPVSPGPVSPGPGNTNTNPGNTNPGNPNPNPGPTPANNPVTCPAGYSTSPGACQTAYRRSGSPLPVQDEDRLCNGKGSSGPVPGAEKRELVADSGEPTCKKCEWKSISVTCGSCATYGTCGETGCRHGYASTTCPSKTLASKNLCGTDCPQGITFVGGVCVGGKFAKYEKWTVGDFMRHPGNLDCYKCEHDQNSASGWLSCSTSASICPAGFKLPANISWVTPVHTAKADCSKGKHFVTNRNYEYGHNVCTIHGLEVKCVNGVACLKSYRKPKSAWRCTSLGVPFGGYKSIADEIIVPN